MINGICSTEPAMLGRLSYISQRILHAHLHMLPGVQRRALPSISIPTLEGWVADAAVNCIIKAESLYTLPLEVQI